MFSAFFVVDGAGVPIFQLMDHPPESRVEFVENPHLFTGLMTAILSFLEDLDHGSPNEFETDRYSFFVLKGQLLTAVLVLEHSERVDGKNIKNILEKILSEFTLFYMTKFEPGKFFSMTKPEQEYFETRVRTWLRELFEFSELEEVRKLRESLW